MELISVLETRLEYSSRNKNGVYRRWALFMCPECGEEVEKRMEQGIKNKSCGCVRREMVHNDAGTKLHQTWAAIKKRCTDKNNCRYLRYGGRGISFCSDWNSYKDFKKWALSNGYSDDLYIDRINNDGNYEPSNCRFVSSSKNAQNRSDTKLNWAKVSLIRSLYSTGTFGGPKLAKMFGVTSSHIYCIKDNKTWIT